MSSPPDGGLAGPWGEHALASDATLDLQLGPLELRVRSTGDEIWLAHVPGSRPPSGTATGRPARDPRRDAADGEWVRWPVPEGADRRVLLSPVFPPRPVVAEPDRSFRLLPRARARIFVRVPLWVRVAVRSDPDRVLTEVPSVVLSDTWWGGLTEGELCYWLRTTARRKVPSEAFRPHLAVCPLELSNRSDEELPVEKLVLRVAHLSLFSADGRLWADDTRVRYRGPFEGSEIEVAGRRPDEATDGVRVAAPREDPPARGFRSLSFARLRSLPGLGGI